LLENDEAKGKRRQTQIEARDCFTTRIKIETRKTITHEWQLWDALRPLRPPTQKTERWEISFPFLSNEQGAVVLTNGR
jgi:hypothetical protein